MPPILRAAALAGVAAVPAMAGVPQVVTDTPVVQSLVTTVMGELAEPMLLLDRGADAHEFQLRPSQVRALAGAGLVFRVGPEMTPWLDRALQAGHDGKVVTLLDTPGTVLRSYGGEDNTAEADDGHDHTGTDPHAWLDPSNLAVWVGEIADELSAADDGHATLYRANAALAQTRLQALDRALAERLAPAHGKGLVFGHDAFGYLADRYGLTVAGSLAEGDASDPGAAHVAELRARAERGDVACAFPEVGHDPRGVEQLVAGTPARLGRPLDPEGRGMEPGPELHVAVLEAIATAITDCLAGD